ncbi:EXS-domain-containing protein [Rhizophagus irregularis]|nr:EXS-domain-containing protein [Rhizophagus irregularis]
MTYVGFTFVKFEQCVWILGIILLSIIICPLRIFYYDARKWFIIAMLRVVASGFYRVEFRDFFIADELNSLTYTFMNSQFLFCAINVCRFSPLSPLLTSLPPWWRFIQCLKRYSLTYHKYPHLLNAGKYFSTIVTVWLLFLFRMYNNKITKSLWISGQSISSIYSYSWDVLMDWSLLQLDSQNYLLRDELNFKNHAIYYFAIVSDGLLRFSWTLQLIIPSKYAIATVFVIACGEMLRRWQWNFFRVENEHVNNCGQFRAIKEIPLPFERDTTNDELNLPSEPQVIKLSSRITNAYLPQRRAGFPHQTDDIQRWRDFQPRSNAISYACSEVTDDEHSDINSLDDQISQFETSFQDESNRSNNNENYGSSGTSAIESDAKRA